MTSGTHSHFNANIVKFVGKCNILNKLFIYQIPVRK